MSVCYFHDMSSENCCSEKQRNLGQRLFAFHHATKRVFSVRHFLVCANDSIRAEIISIIFQYILWSIFVVQYTVTLKPVLMWGGGRNILRRWCDGPPAITWSIVGPRTLATSIIRKIFYKYKLAIIFGRYDTTLNYNKSFCFPK